MLRRAALPIVAAAMVAVAVVAVLESMDTVNDAFCGTPRSFDACYEPVLVPALVGAGTLAVLILALTAIVARQRAPLLVLIGSAAIGVILATPVLATAPASDGCNRVSGYLPRVLAPHADWLAEHDIIRPEGGYETQMDCLDRGGLRPRDLAAAAARVT